MTELERLQRALVKATRAESEAYALLQREMRRLVLDTPEGAGPHSIATPGIHYRPTSPIETCVYDDREDPCHDECIYCGEPHERK